MTGVTFIDSTGTSALLVALEVGDLDHAESASVNRLLELAGVFHLFPAPED